MMSAADAVSWAFVYVLIGAVIWMLMFSAGLIKEAWGRASGIGVLLASIGAVVAWPVIVWTFAIGLINGHRERVRR